MPAFLLFAAPQLVPNHLNLRFVVPVPLLFSNPSSAYRTKLLTSAGEHRLQTLRVTRIGIHNRIAGGITRDA